MKNQCWWLACLVLVPAAAAAQEIHVLPGQSIQAAVDRAHPGDRVVVFPGVYHEAGSPCPTDTSKVCAVVIAKGGISLIGAPRRGHPVVLESTGAQADGIVVASYLADGATCLADPRQRIAGAIVSGFTVTGFANDGILLLCVDDWRVDHNVSFGNDIYAIFPSHCGAGALVGNVATTAHDTGIYVGQSHDVLIADNVAFDNTSGFEVENSVRVLARHNESFNNTAGMMLFLSPGLDQMVSQDNVLAGNFIHDNNQANACPPGGDVCLVPPGSGILVIGGTGNRVVGNRVRGNETTGIALLDTCSAFQLSPADCAALSFNPLPESSSIERNRVTGNGTHPHETFYPGNDLFWLGAGTGNCWESNVATVVVPPALPACR
jgi:parallel beta-helix repeat protein